MGLFDYFYLVIHILGHKDFHSKMTTQPPSQSKEKLKERKKVIKQQQKLSNSANILLFILWLERLELIRMQKKYNFYKNQKRKTKMQSNKI